jgi:preprotein translocase subunit SecG
MLKLFIGVLTVLMVLDCIMLVFLILLQLPKKEAGAGLAFGGGATDALFGAGSGNVLTKITTYVVIGFFGLSILLATIGRPHKTVESIADQLTKPSASATLPATAPAAAAAAAPSATAPVIEKPAVALPTNK